MAAIWKTEEGAARGYSPAIDAKGREAMIEYKLVSDSVFERFEYKINSLIAEGWTIAGDVSVSTTETQDLVAQAMTRQKPADYPEAGCKITTGNALPWEERVPMISLDPGAGTLDDVARLAAELMEAKALLRETCLALECADANRRQGIAWDENSAFAEIIENLFQRAGYERG